MADTQLTFEESSIAGGEVGVGRRQRAVRPPPDIVCHGAHAQWGSTGAGAAHLALAHNRPIRRLLS